MPQIAGDDCVHVILGPLIESVASALNVYVEKKTPNVLWRVVHVVTTAMGVHPLLQSGEAKQWMKMVSLLSSAYLKAEEKRKQSGFNPFESVECSTESKGFSSVFDWQLHV